jgi:hypothetical protein
MRTLVLNAGYEPLAVVSFKRAIVLVLNQKATVLEGSHERKVHSATGEYELPSVILLSRYVRVPGSRNIPLSRRGVLRRDGYRCAYCNRTANTVDHVQPKSKGGSDSWDKTLHEIGWELSFTPKMPTGGAWLVRGAERVEPEWDEYLRLSNAA